MTLIVLNFERPSSVQYIICLMSLFILLSFFMACCIIVFVGVCVCVCVCHPALCLYCGLSAHGVCSCVTCRLSVCVFQSEMSVSFRCYYLRDEEEGFTL